MSNATDTNFSSNVNPPLSQDTDYTVPLDRIMAGHDTNNQQPDLSMPAVNDEELQLAIEEYLEDPDWSAQGPSTYESAGWSTQRPPQ